MKKVHALVMLSAVLAAGSIYTASVNASTRTPRSPQPVLNPSIALEAKPVALVPAEEDTSVIETLPAHIPTALTSKKKIATASQKVFDVPFYSQFTDISDAKWKKVGCGIASLAMIIDYYRPAVAVDTLLTQGVAAGAYSDAGWTYKGLIGVGQKYGLAGSSYDLAGIDSKSALTKLKTYLADGPIIASVHYKFEPTNPIPHLVVINRIVGDTVYYNDPAASGGGKHISTDEFLKAWKKRFIVIRPA